MSRNWNSRIEQNLYLPLESGLLVSLYNQQRAQSNEIKCAIILIVFYTHSAEKTQRNLRAYLGAIT